jgi:hypothetical protein
MLKAIKEIILMLLVCLAGILLFAVVFYEYIPSRKVVAEVATYEASEEVQGLLADNIDSEDNDVILTFESGTYEVTTSDLTHYKAIDRYIPGKSNPFATISGSTDGADDDSNGTSTSSGSNSSSSTSNTGVDDDDSDSGSEQGANIK